MSESPTKTKTVRVVSVEPFERTHWLVQLDDETQCAIPRLFDAPDKDQELELELAGYRLDPADDPHQDMRWRLVRVTWNGVRIHAAEFDALLDERDRILSAYRQLRDAGPEQPGVSTVLRQVAGRAAAFFENLASQPSSRHEPGPAAQPGPFPGGAPPWTQVPGAPGAPGGPGPREGRG